jgi:hypothetical protein
LNWTKLGGTLEAGKFDVPPIFAKENTEALAPE